MSGRTGLLLKVALVILIVLGARELSVVSNDQIGSTGAVATTRPARAGGRVSGVLLTSTPGRDDDVYDAVDLYGNEVTAAVATYKLDATGALYELHSPETELPQLAPPKS